MSLELSGKPDAWKLARPVWGWGRGEIPGLHHFILAQGGQTYARLRLNTGPRGEFEIPVAVDYSMPFEGSDFDAWEESYLQCVQVQKHERTSRSPFQTLVAAPFEDEADEDWLEMWHDYTEDQDQTRGFIL